MIVVIFAMLLIGLWLTIFATIAYMRLKGEEGEFLALEMTTVGVVLVSGAVGLIIQHFW